MKYSALTASLSILLFYSKGPVAYELQAHAAKGVQFTVLAENPISFALYDSLILSSNVHYFEPRRLYDTVRKNVYFKWADLPKGNYSLRAKTVFGDTELYDLNLSRDTSIVVGKKIELAGPRIREALKNGQLNLIKIYYRSKGCFHDYKEMIILEKCAGEEYQCTLVTDSTVYYREASGLKFREIPVYRRKNAGLNVTRELSRMIDSCHLKQEKINNVLNNGGSLCTSTTIKTLFILLDHELFQFNDYGICDWDGYRGLFDTIFGVETRID